MTEKDSDKTRKDDRLTPLQGSILKRLPDPLRGVRPQSIRALLARRLIKGEWGGNYLRTPLGEIALATHQMVGKRKKGFAAMSSEKQRQIASNGGKAAHKMGRAFAFKEGDPFAIECGKRGGLAAQEKLRRQTRLPFQNSMEAS